MLGDVTPVVALKTREDRFYVDDSISDKCSSSALTRLRRSLFIAVTYAFDFVFANFGIAIAARMPMMTTTMSSSISVKPLRFILEIGRASCRERVEIWLVECAVEQNGGEEQVG